MATLKILGSTSLTTQGSTFACKQGPTTAGFMVPLEVTITGTAHGGPNTLATATAVTLWDDDDDSPVDWDAFAYCGDQDAHLQFIGTATNIILGVRANMPFLMGKDLVLGAANTTAMSSAPSTTAVDSIVLFQASGSTMNYSFFVYD